MKLQRDDLTKGQRACIVLNAYEAEERRRAKKRQGERTDLTLAQKWADVDGGGKSSVVLAKKAGIGKSSMEYLIAVKRKRPDLFQRVFNGEYTIGKAHAEIGKLILRSMLHKIVIYTLTL